MQIDSLDFSDPVLTVRCSGTFGIGSKGHPSSKLLTDSIQRWMLSHPQERIEQVIIDYTHVDYEWGDGPVSSMLPIIYKGVTKVRLVANPRNRKQHGAEGAADRVAAVGYEPIWYKQFSDEIVFAYLERKDDPLLIEFLQMP